MASHDTNISDILKRPQIWGSVTAVTLLGIVLGIVLEVPAIGIAGCFLGSCILAASAFMRPKKDIVGILTPMYAIIIFFGLEAAPTIWTQGLFAASIIILAFRLELRFGP